MRLRGPQHHPVDSGGRSSTGHRADRDRFQQRSAAPNWTPGLTPQPAALRFHPTSAEAPHARAPAVLSDAGLSPAPHGRSGRKPRLFFRWPPSGSHTRSPPARFRRTTLPYRRGEGLPSRPRSANTSGFDTSHLGTGPGPPWRPFLGPAPQTSRFRPGPLRAAPLAGPSPAPLRAACGPAPGGVESLRLGRRRAGARGARTRAANSRPRTRCPRGPAVRTRAP